MNQNASFYKQKFVKPKPLSGKMAAVKELQQNNREVGLLVDYVFLWPGGGWPKYIQYIVHILSWIKVLICIVRRLKIKVCNWVMNYKINLVSMQVRTLIRDKISTIYWMFLTSLHKGYFSPSFWICPPSCPCTLQMAIGLLRSCRSPRALVLKPQIIRLRKVKDSAEERESTALGVCSCKRSERIYEDNFQPHHWWTIKAMTSLLEAIIFGTRSNICARAERGCKMQMLLQGPQINNNSI